MRDIFTNIYKKKVWSGTSYSGPGSNLFQTKEIRTKIPLLLKEYKVSSLLDCPCGDLLWISNILHNIPKYTGADIVEEIITTNQELYPDLPFITFDITKDLIPSDIDVILIRDLFVHFSYSSIKQSLSNIRSSNCKYILTTHFPLHELNQDIANGEWRTLNFTSPPFNFPEPLESINEKCTEVDGQYSDKSLALWETEMIKENLS